MMTRARSAYLSIIFLAVGCGEGLLCPRGTERIAGRCVTSEDANIATRAMDPGRDAASVDAVCGDAVQSGGEACDDGNLDDGDGCSALCEAEDTRCLPGFDCPPPAAPVIQGASSMEPGRELWTWQSSDGAALFEVRLDGVPLADLPEEPRLSVPLTAGEHTLEVAACDDAGVCSAWTAHHTVSESFGDHAPRGLRGSARAFGTTALGHPVAIGCDDCFLTPAGATLNLAGASAMIERALARGTDVVQLDVASIGGALYVTHTDSASAGVQPLLSSLLALPSVQSSDALVFLDLVENEPRGASNSTPSALAAQLFAVLDDQALVARNGRPLWLRTSFANRAYLEAAYKEALRHAITGPYVRFVVSDPGMDVADFYGAPLQSTEGAFVAGLDFVDVVALDYRLPNLPARLERARRAGRAVTLENVPGPGLGETIIAALREQADVFVTRYRVDQARAIVAAGTTDFAFSARDIAADGRVLQLHSSIGAADVITEVPLGASTGRAYFSGTPSASFRTDSVLLPPFLDFAGSQGIVAYPSAPFADVLRGSITSLMGTFAGASPGVLPDQGTLYLASNFSITFQAGAFVFSFSPSSRESETLLTVPRSAGQHACDASYEQFEGPIDPRLGHWLLVDMRAGGAHVFVDGKCAAAFSDVTFDPLPMPTTRSILLGDIRGGFTGEIQQLSSQRFVPSREDEVN